MLDYDIITSLGNIHIIAVLMVTWKTQTLFMLGFPASWPSSSSSSRSLSLSLPLPDALLAERGLSCSESDPEPEPESGTQMGKPLELYHCMLITNAAQYTPKTYSKGKKKKKKSKKENKDKFPFILHKLSDDEGLNIYFKLIDSITTKWFCIKLTRWCM